MRLFIVLFWGLLLGSSCSLGSGKQSASSKEEIIAAMQDSTLTIIDVRTPQEFEEGHLAGAINYPIENFADSMSQLDPAKPVLVVCRTGNKSGKASKLLRESGFDNVYDGGKWQNVEELVSRE